MKICSVFDIQSNFNKKKNRKIKNRKRWRSVLSLFIKNGANKLYLWWRRSLMEASISNGNSLHHWWSEWWWRSSQVAIIIEVVVAVDMAVRSLQIEMKYGSSWVSWQRQSNEHEKKDYLTEIFFLFSLYFY